MGAEHEARISEEYGTYHCDRSRLTSLREDLGILHQAFYKLDNVTHAGHYSFNSRGPVTKYWADYGERALRIPKGRQA